MKLCLKYIFITTVFLLFAACKKYPKNTLYFKKPEVVLERMWNSSWKLVYYSVNDVDSTNAPFLTAWRELGVNIDSAVKKGEYFWFGCYKILDGYLHFSNHKKEIIFSWGISDYTNTGSYPSLEYPNQRNIFLEKGLRWKIDMLTKNEFRIISEFKGTKYEMHFK